MCGHDAFAAELSGDPRYPQSRGLLLEPIAPTRPAQGPVFREALGLDRSDAAWLRDVLLEAVRSGEATEVGKDAWGTHWRLDAMLRRQGKSAVIRTIWIVRTGESVPKFVTCWVL